MKLDDLIYELERIREKVNGELSVDLLIDFEGKGQWEAPCAEVVHVTSRIHPSDRIVLLFEEVVHGRKERG